MIEWLQSVTEATDPVWQWLVIMLAGAIPYVESYASAMLGVIAGVSPLVAIAAGIVGNVVSMVMFVAFADRIRKWRKSDDEKPRSARQQRFMRAFDKYGVAGVSLLGQTLLPSQLTSMAMVALGASRRAVLFWQVISIILWGIVFGLLAAGGLALVR